MLFLTNCFPHLDNSACLPFKNFLLNNFLCTSAPQCLSCTLQEEHTQSCLSHSFGKCHEISLSLWVSRLDGPWNGYRVGLKISVCVRPYVIYTNLNGYNPNSSLCSCFLPVQNPCLLSGYCHQQGQVINGGTSIAFLLGLGIPYYLLRGLTCDLSWLQVLISGNDPKPRRSERKKITRKQPFFFLNFVPKGGILGRIWILHLGVLFLFYLKSNQILTKPTKTTKWFTFFFKLKKGRNRKKNPIILSWDKNISQKRKFFNTVFGKSIRIATV